MSLNRPLNHTGNTAYVWSGAVGKTTDLTAIDPKKAGRNGPGRRCIGMYIGAGGNLVLEVPNPDGYAGTVGNMYFAGLVTGSFLDVSASKVLASGAVKDSAVDGYASITKTSTARDLVVYWEV